VVWLNRNAAFEQAGLCSFVANTNRRPFRLVDVTDFTFATPTDGSWELNVSTANLFSGMFAELLRSVAPTSVGAEEIKILMATWERLREEDRHLRIVDESGELVSAEANYFDQLILKSVDDDWRLAARVVHEVIDWYARDCSRKLSDLFLNYRMWALIDTLKLEAQGNEGILGAYKVRHLSK
jgi:hypothetical protein